MYTCVRVWVRAGVFFERGRYSALGMGLVGLESVIVAATGVAWRLTTRASPKLEYDAVAGSAGSEEQLEPMLLVTSRVMDREGGAMPRRCGSNTSLLSTQSTQSAATRDDIDDEE